MPDYYGTATHVKTSLLASPGKLPHTLEGHHRQPEDSALALYLGHGGYTPMKTNCKFKEFWPIWERHGMGKTTIMMLNIYKDKNLWE